MTKLHVLMLKNYPIYEQLKLEEALLRADQRNWCLINEGTAPAIVMGISGKPEQHIHQHCLLPLIKRFSGGGTVVVDENTLFVTFICNAHDTQTPCYPKEVLNWTTRIYKPIIPHFQLLENDYAIHSRKFGGNAQYMCKERWLHHSSLLWDYHPERMSYLKMPPKMPLYRENRSHTDFLCTLKLYQTKEEFTHNLLKALPFPIVPVTLEDTIEVLQRPHRSSTAMIVKKSLRFSLSKH